MAESLEPPLAELLIRLVELDGGNYETFVPHFTFDGTGEAELIGFDDEHVPEGPIRELDRLGLLDMEPTDKKLGKFSLTADGRRVAAQIASEQGGAVDFSWPTVAPVLAQIEQLWKQGGAPFQGLNGMELGDKLGMSDEQLVPILAALRGMGLIEYRDQLGPDRPNGIKPTPEAIAQLNGWPSGDDFGRALLAALEERIEAEPDPDKQSKWRTALSQGGEGFRELIVEVAAAIASRQISGT